MLERFLELPHASCMQPQALIIYILKCFGGCKAEGCEPQLRSCCIAPVSKTEVLETPAQCVSKTCLRHAMKREKRGSVGGRGKRRNATTKETIKRNPAPDPTGKANIFWGKTPCGEGDEGSREGRQGRGSLGHIPRGWEISP